MEENQRRINKKQSKGKKYIIITILVCMLVVLGVLGYKYITSKSASSNEISNEKVAPPKPEPEPDPPLKIFQGNSRPIAIMIDNEVPAWPHSGLADAYMIYEMIIEGGQTRMMALFKNQTTKKIGPIRSSRHYFVEYAMEHNAIYTHFGWSPKAEQLIKTNSVNNVNGLFYDGTTFWRVGSGYHNSFTNIDKIRERASNLNYLQVGSEKPIYKYSSKEYNLKTEKEVASIKLTYSPSHNVSYVYDTNTKLFMRSMRGIPHKDRETKVQYSAKNIVVMKAKNYTMGSAEDKGRQEIENTVGGVGMYFTNGKACDITWKKDGINSKTCFYDAQGEEIILNDGQTFVQIVPTEYDISVKYKEVVPQVNQ